jgi:acetyltransferase-like isoleucine patch superfamily enzyme
MEVAIGCSALARLARRCLRITPLGAAWRIEVVGDLAIEGRVWIPGAGRISIGRGARLVGKRAAIELRAHEGGEIVIGDGALIEDGASIEATRSVVLGANVRVGPFCKIIDNHFHRSVGDRSERPEPKEVSIGDGAVIGARAVVLPGGGMGAGAWLGPAEVLSFHLPAWTELPKPGFAKEVAR